MKKVYFDYGSGWEDVSQYIRDNLTITDRFANSSYHYAQNVANLTMLIGDVPEVPDGSTPYYYMDGWTEATASGWIQTLSEDTLPTTRGGVYQRDFVTISGGYDYVLKLKCTSTGPSVIALVGERSDDEFELVTTANLPGGESVVTFEFTSPNDYTGLGFIWDARVNVEWNWLYIGDGVWESNLDKLKAATEVKVLIQDVVSEEDSAFEVYSEEDWTEATASGWTLTLAPEGYPDEYGGIYKKDFLTESFELVQITLNTPLTTYMPIYLCGQITGDTFEILSSENAAPGSSTVTFTLPSATTVSGLGLIWRSDVNIEIEKIYLGDKVVTQLFQGLIAEKPSYDYDGIFENIQIDLEATDRIRKLDVEMGDFVMRNAKIMDYTDKDNSIIHQLAYQAGLTDTYIADAQILVTLSGFSPPSEKSNILSEMDKLCYENGYVLHMDVYDKIHPLPWIVASGLSSHTFGETNVIGSISVSESEREFEGVKVTYNELGEKDNVLLYRDDLPYNSDGTFTGYSIPSGYYYPLEANVIDETTGTNQIVYQEYDDTSIKAMTNKAIVEKLDFDARTAMKAFKSDYSAIVATSGHYLEYRIDGGLTPDTVVYNNKKAQVRFNNTTASGVNIYYLNVKGSCLYRTADRYSEVVTVSGSKKIDEYTTSYVFDKTTADTLAQFIAMEQDYGRFTYKFKSDDDVAVGSLVSIINDARMNQDVLILDRTYNNKEDLYEYTCKGYDKDVSAVTGRSITRTPIKDSFDVVSVGLSSYNLNILSDINGENLQLGDASITCTVLVNGMDYTPDWTFSEATASGVLGSINGNTYTISGMFSDSGYVDILFHKEHYTDKTLRCNVARIRQGVTDYVIETIPVYTPVYLGAHLDSAPAYGQEKDTYLRYSTTSGLTNRGVFKWDSIVTSGWVRTTDPADIYKALPDIVSICQLLNTDDPPTALYGVEADYGVTSTIETAHIMAAIIDRLRVGDLTIAGVLKSPVMDTEKPTGGDTINTPSPTYWPGSSLITLCTTLADGWHAVDSASSLDGDTISHAVKSSSNAVSLQASDTLETSVDSITPAKTITSAAQGLATIYFDVSYPTASRTAWVKINGVTVYSSSGTGSKSINATLNIGDMITFGGYSYFGGIGFSNCRLSPASSTIALWNSTDSTAIIYESAKYYNNAGTVNINSGTLDTSAIDDYWLGSVFIASLIAKLSYYKELPVDGGTFNIPAAKTCASVYLTPTSARITFSDASTVTINATTYYNYTGAIDLPDDEGRVLVGDENTVGQYEIWTHYVPGSSNTITTFRNKVTGARFSITETRAPDQASGDIEATHSLHAVHNSVDFVRDLSLHNYSGDMHVLDVFSNFTNDTLGDWKWYQQRHVDDWVTGTAYSVGDLVVSSGNVYICTWDAGGGSGDLAPVGTGMVIFDTSSTLPYCGWQYLGPETPAGSNLWGSVVAQTYSKSGQHWVIGGRKPTGKLYAGSITKGSVFAAIAPALPIINDEIIVSGNIDGIIIAYAVRNAYNAVTFYGASPTATASREVVYGSTATFGFLSIAW